MTHPGLQPRAPVQQQENGVGRSLRLAQQVATANTEVRHQNEALLRRAVSTTAIGSERAKPCTISRLERLPALDSGGQSPPTGASTRPPRAAARGSRRFRFPFPRMQGLGRCPAASSQVEVAAGLRDPPPTHRRLLASSHRIHRPRPRRQGLLPLPPGAARGERLHAAALRVVPARSHRAAFPRWLPPGRLGRRRP